MHLDLYLRTVPVRYEPVEFSTALLSGAHGVFSISARTEATRSFPRRNRKERAHHSHFKVVSFDPVRNVAETKFFGQFLRNLGGYVVLGEFVSKESFARC
jgi:hypothetical protein